MRNSVTGNLAIFTSSVQPNQPLDNHAVDFPATFDVDGGNVVRDNAAGGSTRLSYRYPGQPCVADQYPATYSSVSGRRMGGREGNGRGGEDEGGEEEGGGGRSW